MQQNETGCTNSLIGTFAMFAATFFLWYLAISGYAVLACLLLMITPVLLIGLFTHANKPTNAIGTQQPYYPPHQSYQQPYQPYFQAPSLAPRQLYQQPYQPCSRAPRPAQQQSYEQGYQVRQENRNEGRQQSEASETVEYDHYEQPQAQYPEQMPLCNSNDNGRDSYL